MKGGLGRYFFLVGLGYLVTTLGAALTDYLTNADVSKRTNLLVSGGVGLGVALLLGVIDLGKGGSVSSGGAVGSGGAGGSGGAVGSGGAGGQGGPGPMRPGGAGAVTTGRQPRRRGVGAVLAGLALVLAVCAGGGYLVTTAVTYAATKLETLATPPWVRKTQQPGVERLAQQVSKTSGPLTVTVLSVAVNEQVTMVRIKGVNTGSDALDLPVFHNAQLTTEGNTLSPDPAAGDWPETVPADGQATGVIVFDGRPPDGATEVTLSFSTIYGSLNGPRSIAVTMQLNAAP